mmetsp:Transcript_29979/g.69914  ORF Transcript_29979/g.69914 Transcript_29979/m.69914 type:complete len:427 (-) Transcript_29979:28-1308(-)
MTSGSTTTQAVRTERIPQVLQSVFLQSNRGKEVYKAPPKQQAQRTFFNNWIFRRDKKLDETKKKEYNKDKDQVLKKSRARTRRAAMTSLPVTANGQSAAAPAVATPPVVEPQQPEPVAPPPPPPSKPQYTLQEYFDHLLEERGYKIQLYETLKTGYSNPPTPLQIASYGPRMVQIVRSNDDRALRDTLGVGLSPNPCNQFGESLLHMICRRGDTTLLTIMMEAGTSLQVCDDFGRTPLHDGLWSANPAFDVVSIILKQDAGMFFMKDRRGALPLSYVHKDHWPAWFEWFDKNLDQFFPKEAASTFRPSELVSMEAGSIPVPDAKTELSLELIRMVANGEMNPEEARVMAEMNPNDDDSTVLSSVMDDSTIVSSVMDELEEDDVFDDSDFDSDDSDYYSDDDDSDLDMDDDEMMELMQMADIARNRA